jgi:hypothetical protein
VLQINVDAPDRQEKVLMAATDVIDDQASICL